MRVWVRLRRWVEEEAQSARIYRRLADTALLWKAGRAGLFHDPDLGITRSWREEHEPTSAWAAQYGGGFEAATEFLDTSTQEATAAERAREVARERQLAQAKALAESQAQAARNFKRFAAGVSVLAVVAVILSVWAYSLKRQADENADLASKSATVAQSERRKAVAAAEVANAARVRADSARAEADSSRALADSARTRAEELAVTARHEQGIVWLERARSFLKEKRYLGAELFAARAIGFEGFGRAGRDSTFATTFPILLRSQSEEQRTAERMLRTEPEFPTLWKSPSGGLPEWVLDVAFSPDGTLIASCGSGGSLRLWDVSSGEDVVEFEGHDGAVNSVSFSSDGGTLASAGLDWTVRLWDIASREEKAVLRHNSPVRVVAFHPQAAWLTTGSSGSIRLWDATSGRQTGALEGHQGGVEALAYSPDGRRLASAGLDWTVRFWDVEQGTESISGASHLQSAFAVAFHPDGTLVASGGDDRKIRVWDVANPGPFHSFSTASRVHDLAFAPHGILAAALNEGEIRFFDVRARSEQAGLKERHSRRVGGLDFSPDGALLLSGSADHTVRLWDVASKTEQLRRSGHTNSLRSVRFSADGRRLVTASLDRSIRLWDVGTGRETAVHALGSPVEWAAFSPDVATIVTLAGDTAQLWDAESLEPIRQTSALGALDASFDADGKRLGIVCRDDDKVRIWDVTTGDLTLLSGHQSGVSSVAFNPDGATLASADRRGSVWRRHF